MERTNPHSLIYLSVIRDKNGKIIDSKALLTEAGALRRGAWAASPYTHDVYEFIPNGKEVQ